MNSNNKKYLPGMGAASSLIIFSAASLILILETKYLIPWFSQMTNTEPVLWWFIIAGLGMFTPLILLAFYLLKREGALKQPGWWSNRLRFRCMNKGDWLWTLGAICIIVILSLIVSKLLEMYAGKFDHQPPFMSFELLTPGRYWLLAVWFPYWLLNIMGEEILWRGVMLPRQEAVFGRWTWLLHGTGWAIFHIAFGWQLLITLLPILYIQSYVVQQRKNSWIGVVIHAGINGPGFLAISFGLL
jgi:membrane protease YdiL (CAAX protease family)